MSRILLLLPFLIWLAYERQPAVVETRADLAGLGLFFTGVVGIVLMMGLWSRLLARRVTGRNVQRSLRRFNRVMNVARLAVPAWFGAGVFLLGWGAVVHELLSPLQRLPLELPLLIVGTAPAFAMWMGLWWSQFPADRALREQNLLIQLNAGLPTHAPPSFNRYFTSNLRLQLLFILVPVMLIIGLRDVLSLVLMWFGLSARQPGIESMVLLGSSALVFVAAPEILRHVLHTQPLPPSPLRNRLEGLCARTRLRYRDILLWRTDNNMGNAAVMGIIPQVRYILLSDLLLETMTDQQVEAVFAHEVGHIVHRHMAWYVVMVIILMLVTVALGTAVEASLAPQLPTWLPMDVLMTAVAVGGFLLMFGYLSRCFERQADVYAARTMQREWEPQTTPPSYVGEFGASVFSSALHRVASINNIPVGARNLSHGSIASRMKYLHELSGDPRRTSRFDHFMLGLYATMLGMLIGLGVLLLWN